jgi:predicted DNA-binding antitoxin AbrB/MazE fold protein
LRYYQIIMIQTTTAIYENGLLRPNVSLDLPEHSEVEITIRVGEPSLRSKVSKALQLDNLSNKKENLISNERRQELAKIFSSETSLAEYINEDRESR